MKPEIQKPRVCDGCKKLEERISVLAAIMRLPAKLKCECGLYMTRRVTVSHPVAGMRQFYYCDYCQPRDLYQDGKMTVESEQFGSDEDHMFAVTANEALCGSA